MYTYTVYPRWRKNCYIAKEFEERMNALIMNSAIDFHFVHSEPSLKAETRQKQETHRGASAEATAISH
jgi:hypothetical protein